MQCQHTKSSLGLEDDNLFLSTTASFLTFAVGRNWSQNDR